MITVEQAADKLGKSPQVIRIMLQRGLLPFGVATKMPESSIYTYVIFPEKFKEYCGAVDDEDRQELLEAVQEGCG